MDMPKYVRHSLVDIEPVLAAVSKGLEDRLLYQKKEKTKAVFNGQTVGVHSLRMQTFFVRGTTCKCCGLKATHFAIERSLADERNNVNYHLNLWGINAAGEEVLFTHDHILARALGGRDHIDNCQTMCGTCNWEKGIVEGELVKARKEKMLP